MSSTAGSCSVMLVWPTRRIFRCQGTAGPAANNEAAMVAAGATMKSRRFKFISLCDYIARAAGRSPCYARLYHSRFAEFVGQTSRSARVLQDPLFAREQAGVDAGRRAGVAPHDYAQQEKRNATLPS